MQILLKVLSSEQKWAKGPIYRTLLYAKDTRHTRMMADNGKSFAWHTDRRKTKKAKKVSHKKK